MPLPLDQLRADCASPLPHPDEMQMHALGRTTLDWIVEHFHTLPDQRTGKTASRADLETLLHRPLAEEGRPFDEILTEFAERVVPHVFFPNHPRFLAFIPAAPTFPSMLGEFLCAGSNFFAGVWLEASGPAQVELVVLDWFKELLHYPKESAGILTSGGSEANLIALVAARETLSLDERPRSVLYVSEQRHWSVDRAARIIGLLPHQIRPVAVDDEFRMSVDALARAIERDRREGLRPWAVAVSAGATNTGAVDPLDAVTTLCHRHGVRVHVDAAYGWTMSLVEEGRALLAGIERADSVTMDPHKWLAQTYDVGCVLVRDAALLRGAFALRPEYMQDVEPADDEVNFCDLGPALTRRFRALKVWLSLQYFGLGWYRRLVERCCRLAELSRCLLEEAGGFEVLPPRMGIVCFRREGGDDVNLALVEASRATGRVFISSTTLRGRVYLRFCFVNWRTTTADVEEAVRLLRNDP